LSAIVWDGIGSSSSRLWLRPWSEIACSPWRSPSKIWPERSAALESYFSSCASGWPVRYCAGMARICSAAALTSTTRCCSSSTITPSPRLWRIAWLLLFSSRCCAHSSPRSMAMSLITV
jgi:hypothetical protein